LSDAVYLLEVRLRHKLANMNRKCFCWPCRTLLLLAVAVTLGAGFIRCAAAQSMPGMAAPDAGTRPAHHHHEEDAAGLEKLGEVHFPISCSAEQAPFERGIALLHSFGYTKAEEQFQAIVAADPTCAMAHWGVAMAGFHELWGRPDATAMTTGEDEMAEARKLAHKTSPTPREMAYINALSVFYKKAQKNFQSGADAYVAAMAELHAAYPQDVEGAAFYALALLADVAPNDTSLTKERAALAVLIPLFHQYPDHPGLAHYIIHTCDTPALAAQGLEAAQVYARIAPSSPHALHMPGHIFARLGMWPEDVASNLASVAASEKAEAAGQPGVAHQLHADEFLIYAYLQMGQDEKARALTANIRSVGAHVDALPGKDDMKGMGGYFDNELSAIYLMELHDWKALAALQPAPSTQGKWIFYTVWGHGVAAGHLHDAALATGSLAEFDKMLDQMKNSSQAYQVQGYQVQRDELLGWQEFAAGHTDAAIEAMRRAAVQQDKLGQGEVDIPAREMLGDLLMLLQRPKEALAEYRVALELSPNRLNGLLGAGEAAEAAGDVADAKGFYEQAARNTGDGARSARPAVAHAVQFTATHTTVAATQQIKPAS
jgi:tetratricopeptide (TPR) repeat protein